MTGGVRTGVVAAGTARSRAVAIAGLLAEWGVTRLEWEQGGRVRVLEGRETDLPGMLSTGVGGEVRSPDGDVVIRVTAEGLVWSTHRAGWAAEIADLCRTLSLQA